MGCSPFDNLTFQGDAPFLIASWNNKATLWYSSGDKVSKVPSVISMIVLMSPGVMLEMSKSSELDGLAAGAFGARGARGACCVAYECA